MKAMKVLITGGTNGMGLGVTKHLATLTKPVNEVIILCRNKDLGEKTLKEIEEVSENKSCSVVLCDLAKFSDVKNAIKEIKEKHEYLDSLFVNAGLGYVKNRVETEDKFERTFQVNYLSHFYLTLNLLELLEKSEKGGRVIFNATDFGKIDWEDMQQKNCKWNFEKAIQQGMIFKRMFMYRLHNLYRKNRPDSKMSFIALNSEKVIWSNQIKKLPCFMKMMAYIMVYGNSISIEKCGEMMSTLFVESQEESLKRSGTMIDNGPFKVREEKKKCEALDEKKREELWNLSVQFCNDENLKEISDNLQK